MTEEKRQLKVFLCHAKADRSKVQELYRSLRRRGVSVWFSGVDLLPGQDIKVEIPKAVDSSDAIIICLTQNSVDKEGYIQTEIKLAVDKSLEMPDGRIFLIPARLEESDLPYNLKRYHAVNLYEKEGFTQLMKALKLRASQLERTMVELPKERESTSSAKKVFEEKKFTRQKHEINKNNTEQPPESFVKDIRAKGDISDNVIVTGSGNVINLGKQVDNPNNIPKEKAHSLLSWFLDIKLLGFLIALAVLLFGNNIYAQFKGHSVFVPAVTPTLLRDIIPTPLFTPTNTVLLPIATSTSLPTEITDIKGVPMALVPMGEFIMGSNNGQEDEKFTHNLNLDSFYIDKYEVTNFLYKTCVEAGECSKPQRDVSYTRESYYGDLKFDSYPVIYVNWDMAMVFCKWRGARLPYESEWEKAARGVDGRIFPWGDVIDRANANYLGSDTLAVGSYEDGKSIYGLYDMAGNVWEWTGSIYKSYPYVSFDGREELGLMLGSRVFRGGSWGDTANDLRSSIRIGAAPLFFGYDIGFRCAKDVP